MSSPDLLGHEDIRGWLYYLIAERKQAPSTVNLAINAVRSFFGGLLQRDYVSFIYSLAKHCRRSPDLLGHEDIRGWLYYLIAERKQAPSTVNLAINAVRSFRS